MSWLYYLLEANLYLFIFYGFYRLCLHHETFYHGNRYYLLGASLLSFVLPILQLGFLKPAKDIPVAMADLALNYGPEYELASAAPTRQSADWSGYLYTFYLLIAAYFAVRLMVDVARIINLWLRAKKKKSGRITLVEVHDQTAFSFFNLLFIHPHLAEKRTIVEHEMIHIRERHSVDILFFEVMQIICWFNPAIYFLKKDIKLLHEYIADEHTTQKEMQKHEYALFLIHNSFGISPTPLTNQFFNQSILKSRINMLNKKKTAERARLKFLLALPLFGGMLCTSTVAFTKDYGYLDLLPEKSGSTLAMFQDPPQTEKPQSGAPTSQPPLAKKGELHFSTKTQKIFLPEARESKNGAVILSEKRLIVINGSIVDNKNFNGAKNFDHIQFLSPTAAIKKYGAQANAGAVEINGKNIYYFKERPKIPLPRKQVKFPPPRVVEKDRSAGLHTKSGRLVFRADSLGATTVKGDRLYATNGESRVKEVRISGNTDRSLNFTTKGRPDTVRAVSSRVIEVRPTTTRKLDSVRVINLKLEPTKVKTEGKLKEVRIQAKPQKPSQLLFEGKEIKQ
ncbi:MAG: M56 family metallopeptidase [Pedobacter sp.]|nr:M56 family metallopeptidase [Pedobacter sp.]